MTRPELHVAVANTKNTATNYNENFSMMLDYIEDEVQAAKDHVDNTLSIYETINALSPTTGTVTLEDNKIYKITPSGNVTFSLPNITDNTKFHQILVQINMSVVYTMTLGTTYFFDGVKPLFTSTGLYDLIYEYDNASENWVCGAIYKGEVA